MNNDRLQSRTEINQFRDNNKNRDGVVYMKLIFKSLYKLFITSIFWLQFIFLRANNKLPSTKGLCIDIHASCKYNEELSIIYYFSYCCLNIDAYLYQFTQYYKLYKTIKKIKSTILSNSYEENIVEDYRRGWKGLKKIAKPVYSLSHPHSVKSKSESIDIYLGISFSSNMTNINKRHSLINTCLLWCVDPSSSITGNNNEVLYCISISNTDIEAEYVIDFHEYINN
ncbi:hypothetical protein H8356DRAFT_1339598 [Neocallimastix lanati (nom. inval.)]|nr:hypothetical protein H8356DRAFT_1339598 [Neocallimastix sp. JGI-2020a]